MKLNYHKSLVAIFFVALMMLTPIATAANPAGDLAPTDDRGDNNIDKVVTTQQVTDTDKTNSTTDDRPSISPAVRLKLSRSTQSDKIPVILTFRTQPEDQLPLDQLTASEARVDMRTLAADSQAPTLKYLRTQAQRGQVADIQSLYLRNAIAVEANPDVIREVGDSQAIERVILDTELSNFDDPTSESGLDEFRSGLHESGNETINSTGFERVASGERARGVEEIQAGAVQDSGITGSGVNVSVIDSGIDDSHPALEGTVIKRQNFVDNETDVGDLNGHGTHVAGTIAGQNDAKQAVGVAPGARLFDARALDENGAGKTSDIIRAFEWSAENNADVASASLGLSPVVDTQETNVQVANETTENVSFDVYSNATETNSTTLDGFRPAYIYVYINGATVLNESSDQNQTTAVENLTLRVLNPNGTETLDPTEAGFAYQSGTVPDGTLLYKFKPSTVRQLSTGNWSLSVTNQNKNTGIEANVTTAPVYPSDGTDEVSQAVNNLESTGTIPVVAAGNAGVLGNQSVASPAAAENAITVGASNANSIDAASFSSQGPVGFGNNVRPGVDLLAPGVDIVSSGSSQVHPGDEPYVSRTGTSMATPHVSGTIALLLDADPAQSQSDIETALKSTAQAPPVAESAVGAGAIDAYAATESVRNESLTGNQSSTLGPELYAGFGNTSRDNIYANVQPDSDPVGDAGSAPDIEAAGVDSDYNAEFQLRLADDTAPNATFVTYVDADQNDSTGDPTKSGAEYRLNLTRTYTNGTYIGSVETYSFNQSTLKYEPTDLRADAEEYAFSDRPQYVQYDLATDEFDGINTSTFDWHVVSTDPDSDSQDRFPDAGEADTKYTADIDGIGVAWNATAGGPVADSSLQFRLYNGTGVVIKNRTVQTDTNGIAQTTFEDITPNNVDQELTIEIANERGSTVRQSYKLYDLYIDRGPQVQEKAGDSLTNYEVIEKDYATQADNPVELNIPVYRVSNETIVPYDGPASVQFEDDTTVTNLTIDNGILTYTVDPATLSSFDNQQDVDYDVALTANYTDAVTVYEGGDITAKHNVNFQSNVVPDAQVTPPQTATSVSFQTIEERDDANGQDRSRSPSNVTSAYEVIWITDRNVAALYNDLPADVATSLADARQTGGQPESLTRSEREAVDAALDNISAQGSVTPTETGTAAPTQRGIGQFDTTPPEDARIGFVTVTPDTPTLPNETVQASSDEAVVFVDQRLDAYQRTPTAPSQDDQYDLDIDGYWDSYERDDGLTVPNESIEVDVQLRDQTTNEPVANTDVVLYTTGGDTVTVTTDGEGEATTTIPAPELDYPNVEYHFTQQQILGIAQGLQTNSGQSVSDTKEVYASVYTSDEETGDVFANPSITYDETNETLGLDVTYRNTTTFEKTNATTSLALLGTPDTRYDTQRDVFAGYVGSNTDATTISREFNEPFPADQERRYEVTTRTTSRFTGYGSEFVNGVNADIDSPREITAGDTANVTVTLTNRTNDPVSDATVLLYYTEQDSGGTITSAGNALTGTTNTSGAATFTLAPDLADEFDNGRIRLRTGYATDRVANHRAEFESIQVVSTENITGTIKYPNGTLAADSLVAATTGQGDNRRLYDTRTDESGVFTLPVVPGNEYDVGFAQVPPTPDGTPDVYTFTSTGTVTGETNVGVHTLPTGHSTTIEVIDSAGDPVPDARVDITSHRTQSFDPQGLRYVLFTDADGQLNTTDNSFELADNVTVTVTPPADAEFISDLDQYTRQLTVTDDRSLTIELVRDGDDSGGGDSGGNDTTPPTVNIDAPDTVTTGQPFTIDASESFDKGGIANYTFELPNGTTYTQSDPQREVLLSGTGEQEITVTVTDTAGNQNSSTVSVTVVEGADLNSAVSVPAEQRLQDGVSGTVTVDNVGSSAYQTNFDVVVTASNDTLSKERRFTVNQLNATEEYSQTIDFTSFAEENQLTGDVIVDAVAAPNATEPEITRENNIASAQTEIIFSDIGVQVFAPEQSVEGEQTDIFVLFRNEGTATSDPLSGNLTGAAVSGGQGDLSIPELRPGEVNTTKLSVTAENTTFNAMVKGDDLFPTNNESSAELTAQPYTLSLDRTEAPAAVEAGETYYVSSTVSANIPGSVNLTLDTPTGLSVAGERSQERFIRGTQQVTWEIQTAQSLPADTTKNVSINAAAFNKTASGSATTDIVTPKVQVSDQNVTTLQNESTDSIDVGVRNETTYEHTFAIDVQAGSDGRTLKGLDYLVRYPYGCVEQTTSPMLTALNTDQYYRDEPVDYDQSTINGSIASGADRLGNGTVGQHSNGAWSMYGSNPSGDVFYTIYALYGTSEVANDPVQGNRTGVKSDLSTINQTAATEWLDDAQASDGSFETNHYYDDRQSMTGLALISLDQAQQAGAAEETVTAVQADAVRYLLAEQNDDGSWNANGAKSPMATGLAVRGLTTATAGEIDDVNSTELQTAVDKGSSYLIDSQQEDGSWAPYHDSSSFNRQGTTSETTAHAILALDATGMSDTNATVQRGVSYLQTVYEEDGSWGYTRATAISIEALQAVSTQGGTAQDVTVTLRTDEGVVHNSTVTVGEGNTLETIRFSGVKNETLKEIRAGSSGDIEVVIETDGDGLIIVSASNNQLINENEYTDDGGA